MPTPKKKTPVKSVKTKTRAATLKDKSAILPEELSQPMKDALIGVALMPVTKETKLATLIKLLERPEGATIDDMVAATGWQKHSIRGAMSGFLVKKRGLVVTSVKEGGIRRYNLANNLSKPAEIITSKVE